MPAPTHILFVEDDPRVGAQVAERLRMLDHDVEWVRDGDVGLRRFTEAGKTRTPFALVVLDLSLPTLDGLDVCRRLRTADPLTPVLILSGRATQRDVVRGLEFGADDYVTKPFDSAELVARVQGLLRRSAAAANGPPVEDGALQRGTISIDPLRWRVRQRGQAVALTPKEFELLLLLARHPGRTFSRDELLDTLWGPDFDGYGHTVNTHINRLRRKIETDPARPTCIETVWGVGYRFAEADAACP